jgi:hypothetical protein
MNIKFIREQAFFQVQYIHPYQESHFYTSVKADDLHHSV